MTQVVKKGIKLNTDNDGINGAVIPANAGTPSNYTPGDTTLKGHLNGIDTALGSISGGGGQDYLDNNQLLSSGVWSSGNDLPTTNIYGWNIAGGADFDGTAYIGSNNLTETGAIAAANNHLGNSVYCDFTGSQTMYSTSSAFNTANESFTILANIAYDAVSTGNISGKYNGTNANKSFQWYYDISTHRMSIQVFYDSSGNSITANCLLPEFENGDFYHFAFIYDQPNKTMSLIMNGKYMIHHYDANLATRNNSSGTALTFGGTDGSGSPGNFFDGKLCEIVYYRGVLTFNQVRQLYIYGTSELAFKNQNGRVRIQGETGPLGIIKQSTTSDTGNSTGSFTDGLISQNIPVNGKYDICYDVSYLVRESADSGSADIILADGSNNQLTPTLRTVGFNNISGTTTQIRGHVSLNEILYLNANTTIKDRFNNTVSGYAQIAAPNLILKLLDY